MAWFAAAAAATALVLACVWLSRFRVQELRLVRSISVIASPETVFDLVSQVDRVPQWYLRPAWLPRPLRLATLSGWGEYVPLQDHLDGSVRAAPVKVRARARREFGYHNHVPGKLHYESIFRLMPRGAAAQECDLEWEVRFSRLRLLDALVPPSMLEADTAARMHETLLAIRTMAEQIAVPPSWQKRHLSAVPRRSTVG